MIHANFFTFNVQTVDEFQSEFHSNDYAYIPKILNIHEKVKNYIFKKIAITCLTMCSLINFLLLILDTLM